MEDKRLKVEKEKRKERERKTRKVGGKGSKG